jgi:hypothetical protein
MRQPAIPAMKAESPKPISFVAAGDAHEEQDDEHQHDQHHERELDPGQVAALTDAEIDAEDRRPADRVTGRRRDAVVVEHEPLDRERGGDRHDRQLHAADPEGRQRDQHAEKCGDQRAAGDRERERHVPVGRDLRQGEACRTGEGGLR